MEKYKIPMVPGPVSVPKEVLDIYKTDFGSGDLESEFLSLYNETEINLQKIMGTNNKVVVQTGEGMLALWSALKSCIKPGDRVLSIATGIFGFGIADMARSIGAQVRTVDLAYNQTINNWDEIENAIINFKPKMITVVHCETPSGTLNPIKNLGMLKERHNVPLLYVDAVASIGGSEVLADKWKIDLLLGGSQKCISVPPNLAFVSVSENAWRVIEEVNYVGYDALKPFKTAQQDFYFPYTPYWHGIAVLNRGLALIFKEGLSNVLARHEKVASHCRKRITELGLTLFPTRNAVPSPTVTAVNLPESVTWDQFDNECRKKGLVVGGNYGPLAGKVFRLGHMGSQADIELVDSAIDVIASVIG